MASEEGNNVRASTFSSTDDIRDLKGNTNTEMKNIACENETAAGLHRRRCVTHLERFVANGDSSKHNDRTNPEHA